MALGKNKQKSNKTKFYEGYHTQEFKEIQTKQSFEFGPHNVKQTIDDYEEITKSGGKKGRVTKTALFDMSPKKFKPSDLSL